MQYLDEVELDTELHNWLAGLDKQRLAEVLARRPDVLRPPWPRRLGDLTRRLSDGSSLVSAIWRMTARDSQVMCATQLCRALGDENGVLVAKVAQWLGASTADVTAALESLSGLALAWTQAGRIHLPLVMRANGYARYGLGQPLAPALSRLTVAQLASLGTKLQLRTGQRKQQLIDGILAFFRDAERVRHLVADAPVGVSELLEDFAWRGPELEYDPGWTRYDPYRRNNQPETPARWAVNHGLLFATYDGGAHLPLEVGLALRGPDYRLPFTPHPPAVAVAAVAPEQVAAETSAAALRLLDRMTTVVEGAASEPLPLLKAGGVGARAIKKLAKDTGASTEEVRLVVDLATATHLLDVPETPPEPPARGRKSRRPEPAPPAGLVPTEHFARWRNAAPANQLQSLLASWWELPWSPLVDEKALRAVAGDEPSVAFEEIRQLTMRLLTELEAGTGVVDQAALTELVAWHAPSVDAEILPGLVTSSLAEATLVGAIAANAAGELAHALVSADPAMMGKATEQLVAGACATALFGTDLTAIVTGPPGTELATLLDRVADRETQGSASIWRFSPASVRRAFDNGQTVSALLDELSSVARGELPQSLTYLLNDVGRRHGEISVTDVRSVVVGENPALLVEIAAHRKLAKLGLHSVAPSVLTSTADAATTLAALRDAGYAPVHRSTDGSIVVRGEKPAAVADPQGEVIPPIFDEPPIAAQDPLEHAERLLKAPTTTPRRLQRGGLMNVLRGRHSGEQWIRVIWQLEVGHPAWVSYEEPDGRKHELLISEPELHGDTLDVWCAELGEYRRLELNRIGLS
jgi:hypothetical protein